MAYLNRLQVFLLASALLGYLTLTFHLTKIEKGCGNQQHLSSRSKSGNNEKRRTIKSKDGDSARIFADAGTEDDDGNQPHLKYLIPDLVPNTVHYIWCGERVFMFHHYLSVLSVIKHIKPDKIVLHYEHSPRMDEKYYHRWFDELRTEFAFLVLKRLEEKDACTRNSEKKLAFIGVLLSKFGGIYVSEHTIITKFPLSLRNYTLFLSYHNLTGYVIAKQNAVNSVGLHIKNNVRSDVMKTSCPSLKEYVMNSDAYGCVNVYDSFYPQDIWYRDDAFGRLARRIFYNNEAFPLPHHSEDDLIPNIAHMVWLKGTNIDFLLYLSMLSVLHVANVEVLYLYGDKEPTGYYWDRIKHHPRLKYIRREIPEKIYQQGVEQLAHISDIWRVDLITKYGGIYIDADAIWVKPIDRHLRGYGAVATYDWPQWNLPFPEIINFGVSMGKKNNPFFKHFQESMKFWREDSWTFNGLRQPYKVFERHPDLLHIEPHFQVICFYYKCHPTWNKDFHNINISHLNTPFDWRKDTNALHFTYPTPPELRSHRRFLRSNRTMFTDVARFVLRKANITDWKY